MSNIINPMKTIDSHGNIDIGENYQVNVPSHMLAMVFVKPKIISGYPRNKPCHVIINDYVKEGSYDCIKKHADGWYSGVMVEIMSNGGYGYGLALGRMVKGKLKWFIAINMENYLNLETGRFMDIMIPFFLSQADMDVSDINKRNLSKVLRDMSSDRMRINKHIGNFINEMGAVVDSVPMIHRDPKTGKQTKCIRHTDIAGRVEMEFKP